MNQCLNSTNAFVDESLEGILLAYPHFYQKAEGDCHAIIHNAVSNKVCIVTGGGYGHLPLFRGYVGDGLCDGVAVGNIFTSPSCDSILNVVNALQPQKGVLFLFGNYFGDTMNFEMAAETLEDEGIPCRIVKASDDIASAPRAQYDERRGIAGILFAYKIAGAASAAGYSLEQVERCVKQVIAHTASFGVAFSSCTLPGKPQRMFELDEGDMEIGMGIHGEPGVRRGKMVTSKELADELSESVIKDLGLKQEDEIAVLVNGLGSTSREELFVFYRDVHKQLSEKKFRISKSFVGEYATSMEMAGLSISILNLNDEMKQLLAMDASSPFVHF